jgi:hypothetical protein
LLTIYFSFKAENQEKMIVNQPNKYNYTYKDMVERYTHLMETTSPQGPGTRSTSEERRSVPPSADATTPAFLTTTEARDRNGGGSGTGSNILSPTLSTRSSSNSAASSSSNCKRLYIFKLTRSFLGESLGLSLSGNVNLNKTSVFVCGIYANSIAHRHGLIKIGDQILEINGQSIYGRAHSNVTPLIKNIKELDVFLVVLRNPENLAQMFKPLFYVNHNTSGVSNPALQHRVRGSSSSVTTPASLQSPATEPKHQHATVSDPAVVVATPPSRSHQSSAGNSGQHTPLTSSSLLQSPPSSSSPGVAPLNAAALIIVNRPGSGNALRTMILKKAPTGFGIAISEDKYGRLIVRGLNPNGIAYAVKKIYILN